MDNVQLELAPERISKPMGMPFCRLDADKNFTVLKRQHVSRPRLAEKLPMQLRYPAIGNKPNENLWQFAQIRLLPLSHLQTMAHSFRRERLERGDVNRDFSLTITNGNFRNCHSERSEESLTVAAGQTKSISQRCFASLNMTLFFTRAVFARLGSCA
jgi:hypothetical protein